VADLFSGVGPFSVLIGKTHPRSRVYAVDINPEAIKLLTTNVRLNRVENRVFPILGDAKQLAEERLKNTADRVIMNLPENAIDYVEAACKTTKLEGGIIHFYGFVRLPVTIENLQLKFSTAVGSAGRKVKRFLTARKIRETAPYEWQVVLDAEIH
jgi:tRNA (guanine37-N1)-methyltransferase